MFYIIIPLDFHIFKWLANNHLLSCHSYASSRLVNSSSLQKNKSLGFPIHIPSMPIGIPRPTRGDSSETDYSQPAWWVSWVGWREEGEGSSCSMGCVWTGESDNGSIGRNKERAGEVVGYGTIEKKKIRIFASGWGLVLRYEKKGTIQNYDFIFLGIASGHPLRLNYSKEV